MSKAQDIERDKEIKELRKLIKPGETVYTKLNHVSQSGMYRCIDVYIFKKNEPRRLSWSVANVIQSGYDRKHEGVRAGGCGMDMGFSVVYNLSEALYGKGYKCKGKGKCPSNYHTNHHNEVQCWYVNEPHCYRSDTQRLTTYVEGIAIEGRRAHVIEVEGIETICPHCQGTGYVLNPEGPERFDVIHKDGYALKHRWL